jgi:hypothetical protein
MFHITRGKILVSFFALLAVFAIFIAVNSAAQEQKPPSLPTAEMKKLAQFYVGTWEYTETYPKSPMAPNGGTNTGVYTSELGPGGNSIFNHFHSKGPIGDFEGTIVMTWDTKENAYKAYIFGNSYPGAVIETGKWDGDSLTYSGEFSMGTMKFALRNTAKLVAPGKLVSEEFSSMGGAPESLLVHVEAVKK